MLKVKTEKWISVSFGDLEIVLYQMRRQKYKITKIRSFQSWLLKLNIVWYSELTVPTLNVVCRHIDQATLGNQNLCHVYDLMRSHGDLYSFSHRGLIWELFNNKERELVRQVIKLARPL